MWKGNVVRVYTGPDNRSHFEDLSLPLDAIMMEGHAQHRSPTMPVKGLFPLSRGLSRGRTKPTD